MARWGRVKRTRRGTYRLRIPPEEREVLRGLPRQLGELLDADDPSVARLRPDARPDDPDESARFAELVGEELDAGRREALATVEATLESSELTEEELQAWLRALNDLRLVLGTRLNVSEDLDFTAIDDDDPEAPAYALYGYLGWLQEQMVAAAGEGLAPG